MKLAFCLFKYFPYGGLQRDFLRIAKLSLARGHEVHVFTSHWEYQGESQGEGEDHGFHIHLIHPRGLQNHTRFRSYVKQAQAALARGAFDLVIGFNKMPGLDLYYAADVCLKAKVAEKPHFWYRLLPRYRQYAAFEAAVFAKGQAPHILLIAPKQQAVFMQHYYTEAKRFHLLPPGITKNSAQSFTRDAIRESLSLSPTVKLVLLVGSGFKTKGLDRAILALSALPMALKRETVLWVVGQDHQAPFDALIKRNQLQDHVRFLGGRDDVPQLLLAADLLIHPAYHENTGTVLLEALVAGLPVLTTDVCGYADYITQAQAGVVLSRPFDQTKLNEALRMMLTSEKRAQWKNNALHFVKTADIYSLADKAVDYIEAAGVKRPDEPAFDAFMAMQGTLYRAQPGRKTQHIQWANQSYFIKQHDGVGWREIFKNLFRFTLPILGAKNEWQALTTLQASGLAVPAPQAFGKRGKNPARQQSFVLMAALENTISLETLTLNWAAEKPRFTFKLALLQEVARITRVMHQAGINHRDCYLCHFLWVPHSHPLKIYLIDLHRAQKRKTVPTRWLIKDLAGLYFSSQHCALTRRDLLRFIKHYYEVPLRSLLKTHNKTLQKIMRRGEKLYRNHHDSH